MMPPMGPPAPGIPCMPPICMGPPERAPRCDVRLSVLAACAASAACAAAMIGGMPP